MPVTPPDMGTLNGSYPKASWKPSMSVGFSSRDTKTQSSLPLISSSAPRLPAYGGFTLMWTLGYFFSNSLIHLWERSASTSEAAHS